MSDLSIYKGAKDMILIIDLKDWNESDYHRINNMVTTFYQYFPAKWVSVYYTNVTVDPQDLTSRESPKLLLLRNSSMQKNGC